MIEDSWTRKKRREDVTPLDVWQGWVVEMVTAKGRFYWDPAAVNGSSWENGVELLRLFGWRSSLQDAKCYQRRSAAVVAAARAEVEYGRLWVIDEMVVRPVQVEDFGEGRKRVSLPGPEAGRA